jgi:hypothetical protein
VEALRVDTRRRIKLFVVGVVIGVSMFLVGGLREPAHSSEPGPTAQLQPWLEKTMCDYPAVDCTSQGLVVTSPPARAIPT